MPPAALAAIAVIGAVGAIGASIAGAKQKQNFPDPQGGLKEGSFNRERQKMNLATRLSQEDTILNPFGVKPVPLGRPQVTPVKTP